MIAYLKGTTIHMDLETAILDVQGVGYEVWCSTNTIDRLSMGSAAQLFIHTHVREDAFILYGFYDENEREFFEKLLSVSGVGAKLAIAILSTFNVKDLKHMILNEDINLLIKVPGLGVKKGKKLILDIKDKLPVNFTLEDGFENLDSIRVSELEENIYLALESLGYSSKDID